MVLLKRLSSPTPLRAQKCVSVFQVIRRMPTVVICHYANSNESLDWAPSLDHSLSLLRRDFGFLCLPRISKVLRFFIFVETWPSSETLQAKDRLATRYQRSMHRENRPIQFEGSIAQVPYTLVLLFWRFYAHDCPFRAQNFLLPSFLSDHASILLRTPSQNSVSIPILIVPKRLSALNPRFETMNNGGRVDGFLSSDELLISTSRISTKFITDMMAWWWATLTCEDYDPGFA